MEPTHQPDGDHRFSPVVEVQSPAPDKPAPADLSLSVLLDRFPGLAAAHAIAWTGSTAVGWGNVWSDLDLLVFSDQDLDLPADETSETWATSDASGASWTNWVGRYGDSLIDIQVRPTTALERVLEPFLRPEEPEYAALSDRLKDFVYRMSIAVPLFNNEYFESSAQLIRDSSYSRSLARSLKVTAELQLTDVGGLIDAGDDSTARLAATLAAHHTTDHCLVLAGNLCRGRKWTLRRLQSTPECGVTDDEYQAMVLDGVGPGESERDAALRSARWAQFHLARVEQSALSRAAGRYAAELTF